MRGDDAGPIGVASPAPDVVESHLLAGLTRARVHCHEIVTLDTGWEAGCCPPDAHLDPGGIDGLQWLPARVPGTAAAALQDAGRWRPGQESELDARDWWFRVRFDASPAEAGEEVALELGGIATVAEVYLNGERLLQSETMFVPCVADVSALLLGENELSIRCRALGPLLSQRRKPRARWRTRLVDGNLRFYRTMLLGRAPGFAPDPAAVGPWRPVRIVRRRAVAVDALRLHPRIEGDGEDASGVLAVSARLRPLSGVAIEAVTVELDGPSGAHEAALALAVHAGDADAGGERAVSTDAGGADAGADAAGANAGCTIAEGALTVPRVARWWPHTHGEPALHEVRLQVSAGGETFTVAAGRVGFRTLAAGADPRHELEVDGLDLHVNGVRVFARGAVWTPPDPVGLAPSPERLRAALQQVRDAGMNMLRIPGTSVYESAAFHDLCDELGLLIWQDFMFANLDYPIADEGFRMSVQREAQAQLVALAGRPSLAVLCGNSEIEQQVAMLGLPPALGRGELFGELLPRQIEQAALDAIYVPSAPCGGALPFRPHRGIVNYYGVGGYRRPLEDARRAQVRFAAECLAFSNVPNEEGVAAVLPQRPEHVVVHDPRWKAGVPRDAGTGWDFEDVRDHYLKLLFDLDPSELRRVDHERYLELSRAVSGEAMAEVFGEWRRAGSPCGGGLVLWLADLAPGAGWGVIDHFGAPKPAYHHLRRALSPVAVWISDEGLGGLRAHVANDRDTPIAATLRVALYRDGEQLVAQAERALDLPAHGGCEHDVEELLGHFLDASWAYRFGPPGHDAVVATLEGARAGEDATRAGDGDNASMSRDRDGAEGGERREVISQAFRFPAGRPLRQLSAEELGLEGTLRACSDGALGLRLRSRRLAYGVRVHVPGFRAADDALTLEPGCMRETMLSADLATQSREGEPRGVAVTGALTAINLQGRVRVALENEDA